MSKFFEYLALALVVSHFSARGIYAQTSSPFAESCVPTTTISTDIFYVSSSGSDCNAGTLRRPFATINKCTSMTAQLGGGTCYVREGSYPETVHVPSGTSVQAYESETVIVTGLDQLSKSLVWTMTPAVNVWKTSVDLVSNSSRLSVEDLQIFIDNGPPLVEARWPNIISSENLLDGTGSVAQEGTSMPDGRHGQIMDSSLPKGVKLTGAVVQVRGGLNWGAHTGVVIENTDDRLLYTSDGEALMPELRVNKGSPYVISRSLALLNAPNEFYYDSEKKELYLYSEDNPSLHVIGVKMREWGFDLSGTKKSTISKIALLSSSIKMDERSEDNKLDSLNISYISHYLRAIWGPFSGLGPQTGVRLWGKNNFIANSQLYHSAGNGISVKGSGHKIIGNRISFTDYAGVYNAAILIVPDISGYFNDLQILSNTIKTTGRDAIEFTYGSANTTTDEYTGGVFGNSRIAFNDISDFGRLNQDLGGIYICCNIDGATWKNGRPASRTVIDHNHIHSAHAAGNRAQASVNPVGQGVEGASGIFLDNETHGFVISHNVIYGMGSNNSVGRGGGSGIQINGFRPSGKPGHNYDLTINNNTLFDGQEHSIKILAQEQGGLTGTFISNNIFVTPPTPTLISLSNCSAGICQISDAYGVGGHTNYYGNPGFIESTTTPFNLRLNSEASNRLKRYAEPLWTDSWPMNTLCPNGTSCTSPAAPLFGAYIEGGFDFNAGAN